MNYPKRLIEVDLPIARISAHARREKSIRHGHISTLHIWWARRPLAACRAVICAALWPDPADPNCPQAFIEAAATHLTAFAKRVNPEMITEEKHRLQATVSHESQGRWEALAAGTLTLDVNDPSTGFMLQLCLLDFIADFANWDSSTVPAYLETSRALTQAAHEALGGTPGTQPLVVDPFAGGGSIPLEALRVGADAFASDLNPIPVLLNKVVLEYIPKYGNAEIQMTDASGKEITFHGLAEAIRYWGNWVQEQAEKELAAFYPSDPDGATPIAYLWARTILSEAPGQGDVPVEVPLIRSLWLCKKPNRKVALRWVRDTSGEVKTEIVKLDYADGVNRTVRRPLLEIFEPKKESDVEKGTVANGSGTCPVTGFTTPLKSVKSQLSSRFGGSSDSRLTAVVSTKDGVSGRLYRIPTAADEAAVAAAAKHINRHGTENEVLSPVPTESTTHYHSFVNRGQIYGLSDWSCFYSPRQLASLVAFSSAIASSAIETKSDVGMAVRTCLALCFGKLADLANALCAWEPIAQCPRHLFGKQYIAMVWDYAEGVPIGDSSGAWSVHVDRMIHVLSSIGSDWGVGTIQQASATHHPLPSDSVSVLFTDPPYYFSVQYADLADFFYVWFRRILWKDYGELFQNNLIEKADEIIVQSPGHVSASEGKNAKFYETRMRDALAEARRCVSPSGIGTVVFAHTSTAGWEALLGALVDAGWVVTASWPIDTEMATRILAQGRAVLGSSVHLVCRPREDANGAVTESVGEWRDVLGELPQRIHEWMPRMAAEGVVGADAIFACLGPALEIFSRYSRVEKANGEPATLREYLEFVWAAVSTEALALIFKDADASGLEPDARLTAMWLWTIGGGTANGNGSGKPTDSEDEDGESDTDDEEESTGSGSKAKVTGGFILEFDAARKIAQGLGVHLEQCTSLVEVRSDKARLLPVAERTAHLFGKGTEAATTGKGRKKANKQRSLFEELDEAEAAEAGWTEIKGPPPGSTVLDRVHQSMILFAANRGELLKRFLVEDGVGKDARFWKLADNLNKLYPPGTEERRWVEGVLARKKGLGL